ncbi:MAG TPA: class I SAM-dependent methyltransferase [Ktedonobacterales bacterium]|nr:class I SAM-dependent methyltransferase [Ktedonobacterales bacterium]
MNPYIEINRQIWNTWTTHHTQSDHHKDVQRYQATGSSLRSIELAELGEVTGKTLLHLQCNMGADTLSWAKRGALVIGVDVSEAAVAQARALAAQTETTARFLAADLYALPGTLTETFDIVFTSYGVLWWLPDLSRWAEIVASYVKPGGLFYLVDMHPFTNCLEVEAGADLRFSAVYPYDHPDEPLQMLAGQPDAPGRTWTYGLGEVVTALLQAGLQLTYLHEHYMQFYQQFAALVQDEAGWWRWPRAARGLPLLFSLQAMKR